MDSRGEDFQHTGAVMHYREGDRVYCDVAESEGMVLRDEGWGDVNIPVLLDEPDMVIRAPITSLMKV